jgi:hypothetical protein
MQQTPARWEQHVGALQHGRFDLKAVHSCLGCTTARGFFASLRLCSTTWRYQWRLDLEFTLGYWAQWAPSEGAVVGQIVTCKRCVNNPAWVTMIAAYTGQGGKLPVPCTHVCMLDRGMACHEWLSGASFRAAWRSPPEALASRRLGYYPVDNGTVVLLQQFSWLYTRHACSSQTKAVAYEQFRTGGMRQGG